MLNLLSLLNSDRKIIISAVLFVLFFLLVMSSLHMARKIIDLKVSNAQLQTQLVEEKDKLDRTIRAFENKQKDKHERDNFKNKHEKSIQNDRKQGDGDIAPVLHNTIDRLRERQKTRLDASS